MDDYNYRPEKDLVDAPESLSSAILKIILEQMEKSICKIKCSNRGNATGFFCIIPHPDKFTRLPVLMTNYHVINEKDKKIIFTLNNEKSEYEIIIDNTRKVYYSRKYDITIIEIKVSDKLEMNSFLELDDNIFKDNPNDTYMKNSIYLIGYPNGGISKYSMGIFKLIEEDNFNISHSCQSNPGSSGCPIIKSNNNRVIGIHKGASAEKNWNTGILIRKPIEEFNKTNLLESYKSSVLQTKRINYLNRMNNMNIMNNVNNINNMDNINNINNINITNNNMNNFGFNNQINMNHQINSNSPNLQSIFIIKVVKVIEQNPLLNHLNKTGLKNIENASYMNSAIQCLSNINYLSDYLIKNFGNFDIEKQPLSTAFSSLVYDLFNTQNKYISPLLFKKIIGKLNSLFEGIHEADIKDFIFFLLNRLHKELNKSNYSEKFKIDNAQFEEDSFDENKMFRNFVKVYKGKNKSIISDTFYGIIRSTMKCNYCGKVKYSFKSSNLLDFQFKNANEFIRKAHIINIPDLFYCDKKEEILDGENMVYCNSCKTLKPSTYQQIIYSLPKVLIIILNEGRNTQNFNEEFIFLKEIELNTENYAIFNSVWSNNHFYLQCVITHLEETGSDGHFIAYCRNSSKDEFTCYNDTNISKATVNQAMNSNISKNLKEKRTPYILVYHSME